MSTAEGKDDSSPPEHPWPYLKSMFEICEIQKDSYCFKCLLCLPRTNNIAAFKNLKKHVKCPRCQQRSGKKIDGHRSTCPLCSTTLRRVYQFCWACRRDWPQGVTGGSSCTLPGCAFRAALLSNETITADRSSVYGCPFFRACPSCKALLTHTGQGCPNIVCPRCRTVFCYRCLKRTPCRPCTMVDNTASL